MDPQVLIFQTKIKAASKEGKTNLLKPAEDYEVHLEQLNKGFP